MKLLVTGGSGFIGSNFILYWMQHHPSDRIVNLDLLTYAGNNANLKSISSDSRYTFVHGDIADASVVSEAMKNVDTVVHFAAESHVDRSIENPSAFIQTNITGTYMLLEQARKCGVHRFHHISTDEVFGMLSLEDTILFSEKTCYNPSSPYAASKASSDHLVRAYHHTYGLPVTITNCSNNFGPYQHPEKLIPLAITNLLEGSSVPVYGDGKNVRDWLYVEDHCRAVELVLERGTIGETYCVGGMTEDISNLDVVKKILTHMGKPESDISFVTDRPGHDRRYAVDWSKIRDELGWKPQYSFDQWIEQTVHWYTTHESWWKPLKHA